MAYIGNPLSANFVSIPRQSITGNGGSSYTLTNSVTNENELEVFVNNVRQEPGVAYTASGTTLTMTGNVQSTDSFYVVYQGRALATVEPPANSVGSAEIINGSVSGANLATGAAATNLGSSVNLATIKDSGGSNTAMTIDSTGRILTPARPAFSCRPNGAISVSASGWKTTVFSTVDFDIGNNLNAGGYFVCPVTGIYQFNLHMRFDNVGSGYVVICLGSEISGTSTPSSNNELYLNSYVIAGSVNSSLDSLSTSLTISMTAGDNVMPWHISSDTSYSVAVASNFSGFLVG